MTDSAISPPEPTEAFPYTPPTDEIKYKYAHIFEITEPLPTRFFKLAFDKLVAVVLLAFSLPILLFLKIAYVIEGILIPDNKGPMFFYYWGVSGGKKMKKWKLRLIKTKYIEPEGAARHDWIAFSAEWTPDSRTIIGAFAKKWYFDELYEFIFIKTSKKIGLFLWKIVDIKVIDGLGPDGISLLIKKISIKANKFQSGYIYQYAFIMLLGFSALLTYLIIK